LRYGFGVLLPLSESLLPQLTVLQSVDSTNLELARMHKVAQLSNLTAVTAFEQTAGQGRLGRTWVSEPGTSISLSLLIQSEHKSHLGWATLIAACAVRAAIKEVGRGLNPLIKWPNDVLVEGRKISGILAQLQDTGALILGIGLNLRTQHGAPDTATSLGSLGIDIGYDDMLAALIYELKSRLERFEQDPQALVTQTRLELKEHSATLGFRVRAELPGGGEVVGLATDIDELGQLIISTPELVAVAAADVWHLRN
jgi:BirA family biotin operon repressor/biotin-[acetyl-CoA-carboxylase] ligase